jgi:putative CocE/NonD family hydrolase
MAPAVPAGQEKAGANPRNPAADYVTTEAMVPVRDGVRLHTTVHSPKNRKDPLPILLLRTPYGIATAPGRMLNEYLKEFAEDGYVFAFQDIRGRFKSEGAFVMSRPPRDRGDPKAVDEATDAYDTIDWLVKNVPGNNGRVGMLGVSYGGWLTAMALLDPHPALKAVSPQASPADQFLGDDFHHNGAFRLSYGFEYVALMETSKVNSTFHFDRRDMFEWYLGLGALSNANDKYFHGKMPTWNDFVAHPDYDAFWQKQAVDPLLTRTPVPTLNVGGWWDQEDFYGPLKIYEALERHDGQNHNFLVVGPWNHGGWSAGEGKSLGKIPFGSATARHFREKVQFPWFSRYLKDTKSPDQPEALLFETGSNKWVKYDRWPAPQAAARKLYFHPAGRLSFDPPAGDGAAAGYDCYTSDPARPVPYRPRPIRPTFAGPGWSQWQVEDQRFVHQRPDVLTYETAALPEDVTIAGDVTAHLCASTSGTDGDWVVKLIDVYPEDFADDPELAGYQLMVTGEVLRARYRKSFTKPSPVEANAVTDYEVGLHWRDHCFKKGHKIMVQVQSSWFPVIDRNPQKYVENIYKATDADYRVAEQRIYRTAGHPSYVNLPVLRNGSPPDR